MIVQLTWNKRKQSKLESNSKLVPPPLHKQKKREKTIGKNWSECGEGRGSIVHSPFSKESHSSSWRRAFIARGVKTSLRLGSAQKNKPHLRWSRRGATRGLIKRSEPMKTRSYIRYLFHSSYLHTHTQRHTNTDTYTRTGPATTRLLFRKGLNASLSLFINDGQASGSRISATEILRRALEVGWKWWIGETWRSRVGGSEYRGGSIVLKGLKYHWAFRCSVFYEEIRPYERGGSPSARWDGGSGYDLPVSILFRKFIIRYVFVIRSMEGNRDPIFTLFYFVSPVQTRISRERRIFV